MLKFSENQYDIKFMDLKTKLSELNHYYDTLIKTSIILNVMKSSHSLGYSDLKQIDKLKNNIPEIVNKELIEYVLDECDQYVEDFLNSIKYESYKPLNHYEYFYMVTPEVRGCLNQIEQCVLKVSDLICLELKPFAESGYC